MTDLMKYVNPTTVGLAVAFVAYVGTNARTVLASVKSYLPTKLPSFPTSKPTSDLDEILAAIHKSQVKALSKECAVRTPALAECDSFVATVRGLYAEAAQ